LASWHSEENATNANKAVKLKKYGIKKDLLKQQACDWKVQYF